MSRQDGVSLLIKTGYRVACKKTRRCKNLHDVYNARMQSPQAEKRAAQRGKKKLA